MKNFDSDFKQKLSDTISGIEQKSAAEIVVAVSPSSDSYIDTYFKGGAIFGFILLLFILYSPFLFLENFVFLEVLLGFLFGVILVWSVPPVRRILISGKRKDHYVQQAAYKFFFDNNLTETIEHSAFLLYVSIFERRVHLVFDKGLKEALPFGILTEIEADFAGLYCLDTPLPQSILDRLMTLADPFSKFMLPSEENQNELSDDLKGI